MHLRTNLQWAERPFGEPERPFSRERSLVAALDVEWTKNFRVRGASKPFCYSWAIIDLAHVDSLEDQSLLEFGFKSVYLESEDEVPRLLEMIESDIASSRTLSSLTFAGHQLCADLSVLKRSSPVATEQVDWLYDKWRERRQNQVVIDTRYDVDRLTPIASRRLVDVAEDLGLDVTQPELAKGSMTRLHKTYLETHQADIFEKLVVLNLRHSLSTALIAAIYLGAACPRPLNVNNLLSDHLAHEFDYVNSSEFAELVH